MVCIFYKANGVWSMECEQTGKEISSRTYDDFCKNNWENCAYYRGKSSGGCFLSSACIEHKKLSDDCYELNKLRSFRDEYLLKTKEGRILTRQYYLLAPTIVEQINLSEDKDKIYEDIYETMIIPSIQAIEENRYEDAMKIYGKKVIKLKEQFFL